jgi:hypothetical protein
MMNKKLFVSIAALSCIALSCRKDLPNGFEPPDTQIISPADGATLTNAQVTCEWEGLDNAVSFRYKLDDEAWSAWTTQTTQTFFLDEGIHGFAVTAKNEFNREDPTPDSITFTVDAISGPALWIKPRQRTLAVSASCSLYVWMEDALNLMLGSIELIYDNTVLRIKSVEIDTTLLGANGGMVQFIPEYHDTMQVVKVTFGIVGGSPKGVSGNGALFMMDCLLKTADTTSIDFSLASEVRDTLNVVIPLTTMLSATIFPEQP